MGSVAIIYPKPNECKNARFGFSYDWAMIGTALHNAGHSVLLRDYSVTPFDKDTFVSELSTNKIQVAVIEFDSFSLKRSENTLHGQELIETITQAVPQTKIIAYGHYPCIENQSINGAAVTVATSDINAIFSAIHSLLPNSFAEICFPAFDDFPFIDRPFVNQNVSYFDLHKKSTLIRTAIGCENTCIFCQRKGWQEKYIAHSDDYVLREFEMIQRQGIVNLWITDENFTFNLPRAKRLLGRFVEQKLTAAMKICISSWANIDEEFLDVAKEANIKTISFGIETGNADILRFYRKNIDLQKAKAVIRYADKIGIYTAGNFILGAPMETVETIEQSFDFIRECNFDQLNIKTLCYMHGADLFQTLPLSLQQNRTSVFASKESGLCDIPLQTLQEMRDEFLQQYYAERNGHLKNKIAKFGTPYEYGGIPSVSADGGDKIVPLELSVHRLFSGQQLLSPRAGKPFR